MMIIDPVAFGDVACTRASAKNVYDKTGALVSVAANTLAITYDPGDLTRAPYPLVELAASTNLLAHSETIDDWYTAAPVLVPNAFFGKAGVRVTYDSNTGDAPHKMTYPGWGGAPAGSTLAGSFYVDTASVATAGGGIVAIAVLAYHAAVGGIGYSSAWAEFHFNEDGAPMIPGATFNTATQVACYAEHVAGTLWKLTQVVQFPVAVTSARIDAYSEYDGDSLTVGLPMLEISPRSSVSPILCPGSAPVTRAADVIAAGAGLAYSNVAITEPDYNAGTTYAADVVVHDPATHVTYKSLAAGNVGNALTNTAKWTPQSATNRWLMLDQYNNTQTSNAEEILVVLSPQAIAQGLYLGNVDATDVRISVTDLAEGLVYSETQSLVVSNSGASFYNWCFKRIQKKSYAVSVGLPPYANALVTIAIKKPGGIPKCGVCALGPLVDVGLSQYGVGREIKDYSTINFNFDGTSNQVLRNFAKRMDIDVVIDNSQIDTVIETLEGYRQKPVAWIGVKEFGSACLFGRYSNFKSVIENYPESKMNLQIEGTV